MSWECDWYDQRICVFSSVGKCDKSSWMNAEPRPLICGQTVWLWLVTPHHTTNVWVDAGAVEPEEPQVQVLETVSQYSINVSSCGKTRAFLIAQWLPGVCCPVARLTLFSTFPQALLHEPALFWLAVECNQSGFWACVSSDHVTWWMLGCQHKHIKPLRHFQNVGLGRAAVILHHTSIFQAGRM